MITQNTSNPERDWDKHCDLLDEKAKTLENKIIANLEAFKQNEEDLIDRALAEHEISFEEYEYAKDNFEITETYRMRRK